jgi:RNA recognition motif-containing protein
MPTAPGMSVPPGTAQANTSLPPRPGGMPANFQPPANMAHINFSAPVIRLGTMGPGKDAPAGGSRGPNIEPMGQRRGLGMDGGMDRSRQREGVALVPPTREEVMRSIFIGKIPEGVSDSDLDNILRAAGSLRKWTRAYDADGKPCTFGFAEYEDAESLETATEVLQDIEVPAKRPDPKQEQNGQSSGMEKIKLLVSSISHCSLSFLTFSRYKLMTPRENMLKNGERNEAMTTQPFNFELTLLGKHSQVRLRISIIHRIQQWILMEMQRFKTQKIRQIR